MRLPNLKPTLALVGLALIAAGAASMARQDLNALASKGETLARSDPLSAELRNREPSSASRRGFHIGMAAAEGDTLPGPGKEKTRSLLSTAEKPGFDRAVAFTLDRNRYFDLAKVGAAIAKKVPEIGDARTADTDVFFWLGFDIATGLFGDPKLGAKGNTAIGPGSLKIRDSLCPGSQKGFNAAVKLLVIPPPPPPGKIDPNAVYTAVAKSGSSNTIREVLKAPFISDLQVVPGSRNVVLSFLSTQSSIPLIEIGKVEPKPDRYGVMAFGFNSGAFTRFAQVKKDRYVLDVDVQGEQLDIGTTYYYIVNVFNDNKNDAKRPREQVTGKFTTTPQTVKIVWERILLNDDSDDTGTGELTFGLWANYGQPSKVFTRYQNFDMDSGHNYYPDLPVVMENAPDRLILEVRGQDDDQLTSNSGGLLDNYPARFPGDTKYPNSFDVNGAKGEYDLSKFPGTSATIRFRLDSFPGGALKFVIFGRIEITREKP